MKSVSLFVKSETACIPFSRLNCWGFESLFDSPELGTIGGNGFLLKNLVAHQNANDKNTLGIPYGAMSDRSLVDVFGKVLKEMGETQKGTSTWGGINPLGTETVKRLFETFNTGSETKKTFGLVFPVA